jgi:hypothetical protein
MVRGVVSGDRACPVPGRPASAECMCCTPGGTPTRRGQQAEAPAAVTYIIYTERLCKHHGSPGGGEGREPPGTVSRAWRWPGVTPGVGTHPTEAATGPGSTLTARGGADSLWLQRFAFFKASAFRHCGALRYGTVFRDFSSPPNLSPRAARGAVPSTGAAVAYSPTTPDRRTPCHLG